MNFVGVGVGVPKCGSTSLSQILRYAFSRRTIFYLPHTLNLEGKLSAVQAFRFRRSQAQNLFAHYRTFGIAQACSHIERWALDGDLILGGHIDFSFVRDHIARPAKMITLFREPGARCRSEYDYCRAGYREKSMLSRLDATIKHRMAARYSFEGYLDFLLDHSESYGNLATRYVGWDGAEPLDAFFARCVFHSGVLEKSGAFTRGLAAKMGMRLQFPHENCAAASPRPIASAQRTKIERLYARDFMLYEWQLAAPERENVPHDTLLPDDLLEPAPFGAEADAEGWSGPAYAASPISISHVSRTGSA